MKLGSFFITFTRPGLSIYCMLNFKLDLYDFIYQISAGRRLCCAGVRSASDVLGNGHSVHSSEENTREIMTGFFVFSFLWTEDLSVVRVVCTMSTAPVGQTAFLQQFFRIGVQPLFSELRFM